MSFKTIRIIISQPRIADHPSEWSCSVEELLAFGEQVKVAAAACDAPDAPLVVSEKGCRWCKTKATCPALAAHVASVVANTAPVPQEEIMAAFEDLTAAKPAQEGTDYLGSAMTAVDMVEKWCKAVRAETEARLLAGTPVPGFKLVKGRRGHRKWSDSDEVEKMLKKWDVKVRDMYSLSLISPTEAERRMATEWIDETGAPHAPIVGPRNWGKLKAMVTQSEGSPSVAPASDKRPALEINAVTDEFTNLELDDLL